MYITGAQRYEVTDFYSVLRFIDTMNDLCSLVLIPTELSRRSILIKDEELLPGISTCELH